MRPVLCWLGDDPVQTYGVLVVLGYFVGMLWIYSRLRELKGTPGEFWALCYTGVFGVLLGGKLGYWVVEREAFLSDPGAMVRTWRTGWVFWSGFLAALAAAWAFQRVYNRLYRPRRYLPVADYFAVAIPMGHWLGRLGCFAEGCCHGRPTTMPWGARFTAPASSVPEELLGVPLHPTQLYEAAGEAAIFLFLLRFVLPRVRRGRYAYGTVFFAYLLLYSLLRFTVEVFRGDERGSLLSARLSPSQWVSLAVFVSVAALLRIRGIREKDPKGRSLYL